MTMKRIAIIAGLATTLGGCSSFYTLQQDTAANGWSNRWSPEAEVRVQQAQAPRSYEYRQPAVVAIRSYEKQSAPIYREIQPRYQVAPRTMQAPVVAQMNSRVMPRAPVAPVTTPLASSASTVATAKTYRPAVAPRQSSARIEPVAYRSSRPAMPRTNTSLTVAKRRSSLSYGDDSMDQAHSYGRQDARQCAAKRDGFGSTLKTQLDDLIQLQVDQAQALVDADIDVATKSRLMLELSRSVQQLSERSKGLDFFRDGLYSLCQAHASGSIDERTYSTRFDKLVQAASNSIQLEGDDLKLQYATGGAKAAYAN